MGLIHGLTRVRDPSTGLDLLCSNFVKGVPASHCGFSCWWQSKMLFKTYGRFLNIQRQIGHDRRSDLNITTDIWSYELTYADVRASYERCLVREKTPFSLENFDSLFESARRGWRKGMQHYYGDTRRPLVITSALSLDCIFVVA